MKRREREERLTEEKNDSKESIQSFFGTNKRGSKQQRPLTHH